MVEKTPVRAKARSAAGSGGDEPPHDETARAPARDSRPLRDGEYLGRNGEILALKRDPERSIFDIPDHLKDPGWTYEWKREEVFGKKDESHQVHLAENGWRPVIVDPASKWAGHFMATHDVNGKPYVGPIRREGNILMERPKAMTDMVLAREKQRAGSLMRDNIDKYTRRRGAVEPGRGFTTQNPNVPASIKEDYEVGPRQAEHKIAID